MVFSPTDNFGPKYDNQPIESEKRNMKSLAIHLVVVSAIWFAQRTALQAQPYTWTTIAGQIGHCGYADGTATRALFGDPWTLTVDNQGTVYVAETGQIRRIQQMGTDWVVDTLNLTNTSEPQIYTSGLQFYWLRADELGNLFTSTFYESLLGKITPSPTNWVMTTVAPDCNYPFTNVLNCWGPWAIAIAKGGNLYVTASDGTVRQLSSTGTGWAVSIIAGTPGNKGSFDGTNGQARFTSPQGIALDKNGNLYVTDITDNVIRKLAPEGTNWVVTTIAGLAGASDGHVDATNDQARLAGPRGIAVDSNCSLYVVDERAAIYGWSNSLRKVTPVGTNWVVSSLSLDPPFGGLGVAVDGVDNVYLADTGNCAIRVGMATPRLQAICAGDKVVYSWPASASNFVLETSSTLDAAGSWIQLTNGIATSGDYLVLTNALSKPSEFVRLRKQ
jgi:hypothetical protein